MRLLVAFACVAAAACASEELPLSDAGGSLDGGMIEEDAAVEVAMPAEPAPLAPAEVVVPVAPALECPPGWASATTRSGAANYCEPWPGGLHMTCPDGQAHFPGEPGCSAIGAECTGDWPAALPADRPAIFARPGATGGDGTRDNPFGSIAEAIANARPRSAIALAQGTFAEVVALPSGMVLFGACTAGTRIAPAMFSSNDGAINVDGRGSEIHDLTVAGRRMGIASLTRGATLHISGVMIDGVSGYGLAIAGATVTAESIFVRGVQGSGAGAFDGAQLSITRAVFEEASAFGLVASDPPTLLSLDGVAVEHTTPLGGDDTRGIGIAAADGGKIEAVRTVVEDALTSGVTAQTPGSSIHLSDSVVRRTRPSTPGIRGNGVTTVSGSNVLLDRVYLADNTTAALLSGQGGSAIANDLIVERTARPVGDGDGMGVAAYGGALEGHRLRIEDSEEGGIVLAFGTLSVLLDDVAIDNANTQGAGLAVADGAMLTASRVSIENCVDYGFDVFMSDATVSDLSIAGVRASEFRGVGVSLSNVARATIERLNIRDVDTFGVNIYDPGSYLDLSDARIAETRHLDATTGAGAIVASSGGVVDARRIVLENIQPHGVVAKSDGTVVTLDDVQIRGLTALPEQAALGALNSFHGARLIARNVIVEDSAGDGLIAVDGFAEISVARFSRFEFVGASVITATVTMTDVLFSDAGARYGRGISAGIGAKLTLERARLEGLRDAAIIGDGAGTRLEVRDLAIIDTQSGDDGANGCAFDLQSGAVATLERARFVNNRAFSVVAMDPGTRFEAVDLEIRGVTASACAANGCLGFVRSLGAGLAVAGGGEAEVSNFLITGCEVAGMIVYPGGSLSGSNGRVAGNPLGVNVQEPTFKPNTAFVEVTFDNEVNLDSRDLPLPTSASFDPIPDLP